MNPSNRFEFLNHETKNLFPFGLSTFDNLIGGGLPAASVNLIEEDCYHQYSTMLTKAFVSNGIIKEENILIFSEDLTEKNNRFFRELPTIQSSKDDGSNQNDAVMKIAFRYANLPSRFSADQLGEDTSAEKFDFGSHHSAETVGKSSIRFYKHDQICDTLFQMIEDKSKGRFRIVIHGLGASHSSINASDLTKSILKIKVFMRKLKNATCLLTLVGSDQDLQTEYELLGTLSTSIRNQIYRLCDSSLKLVSFSDDGDDPNPYSSDYVGILQLIRVQQLNSFTPYNRNLESNEYGLKLHNGKRHLNIEKLSLPPDLGETVSRFSSSNDSAVSKMSCSSSVVNF